MAGRADTIKSLWGCSPHHNFSPLFRSTATEVLGALREEDMSLELHLKVFWAVHTRSKDLKLYGSSSPMADCKYLVPWLWRTAQGHIINACKPLFQLRLLVPAAVASGWGDLLPGTGTERQDWIESRHSYMQGSGSLFLCNCLVLLSIWSISCLYSPSARKKRGFEGFWGEGG